jgi:hypothetical protein
LALAYKGRDVGRGEEDEGDRKVLDESDVQAVFATELNVGTFEQVKGCRIEASLWYKSAMRKLDRSISVELTLRDREKQTSLEAGRRVSFVSMMIMLLENRYTC